MIVYTENLKEFIKTLLDLASELSKNAGYKVNIAIYLFQYLYASNAQMEMENFSMVPFIIAPKP